MFTQLSLFDSAATCSTLTPNFVHVSPATPARTADSPRPANSSRAAAAPRAAADSPRAAVAKRSVAAASVRRGAAERCPDAIRPMGELAQLVLARYDLLAQRRQQRERLRREQPRKSIRVLSPPVLAAS